MTDVLLLHAPADRDRAESVAARLNDRLVITLPLDAADSLRVGPSLTRVCIVSSATSFEALERLAQGGRCVAVTFEGRALPDSFARRCVAIIEAGPDADVLTAQIADALAGRIAARTSVAGSVGSPVAASAPRAVSVGRARTAPVARPAPARTQAPARRRSGPSLAAVGMAGAALGIAGGVGYVAHVGASDALRLAGAAASETNAAPIVLARFEPVAVVAASSGWQAIAPSATAEEVAARVDAHLSARRTLTDESIANLQSMAERATAAQRPRVVRAASPAPALRGTTVEAAPVAKVADLPLPEKLAGDVVVAVLPAG